MSRWAPDARARLESAAWELFTDSGYEQTSVAQIAARAGLNRATFFRYFADKREVIFGQEDLLAGAIAEGIRATDSQASLLESLKHGLAALDAFMTPDQRSKTTQRVQVMSTSPEIQERGSLKRIRMGEAIRDALIERGADPLSARLGAELELLAFSVATQRWMTEEGDTFAAAASETLDELAERTSSLTAPGVLSPVALPPNSVSAP